MNGARITLTMNIAGPGHRSYAFIIDWHIRLLLAGAWLLLASFVFKLGLNPRSHDALLSLLPAAAVYFLYHPILEVAMRGRTPGKRMAGLRLVDRGGGAAGTTALLIRNLFRLVDCMPALYVVGLVSCFFTAQRARIGDMAAGTLLVLDDAAAQLALTRLQTLAARSGLPLDVLELLDQIIERWSAMEPRNRLSIARSLLARLQPGGDAGQWSHLTDGELLSRLLELRDGAAP